MLIQALLRPECHDALAALVDLVGTIGPAQVFWEEHQWANKRILPGYRNQYRSGTKLWQDVRVTTNSFTLFVQALCEQQKKRLAQLRRRLSPMQLEEHSALAAFSVGWWRRAWRSNRP